VGAVGGAFASAIIRQRVSSEWTVRLSFLGFALCAVAIAASPYGWMTGIILLLGGACWVIALSLFNITVQMSTPRWVVGRALSLYQTATFGGMAVGGWAWGVVAEAYGPKIALVIAAGTMIVGAFIGFGRLALPALETLNLDPINRWKAPQMELDIKPRSGPVKIMIEYVIPEKNVAEFMEMMAERRRIRMRDGARRWSLMRDMEHSEHWIESYHFPTWLEYVRYNQRLTHADAIVGENIRRLHSGTGPLRVWRMIERPTNRPPLDGQAKGMIDLHQ
jgi:hypothetical protein